MTVAAPDSAVPWLRAQAERVDALQGDARERALLDWARFMDARLSNMSLGMVQDEIGRVSREAWKAFERNLAKDTPAKAWADADPAIGRASIAALVGLKDHAAAWYATMPMRHIRYEDRDWIGGALGSERLLAWKQQDAGHRWCHLDIIDVILWDPATNEARVMGEHISSPRIVMPARTDTLHVFGSPAAFFKAWARRRVDALMHHQSMAAAHGALDFEDTHNEAPGALIVGDIGRAVWPSCDAATLIPAAGCEPAALQECIMRSAGLPTIQTRKAARG